MKNRHRPKKSEPHKPDERSALSRIFQVPESVLPNVAQIELLGNREAVVDGCQGILEYDSDTVKLNLGKISVRFSGRGLQIKCMTASSIVVEGFITGIDFAD